MDQSELPECSLLRAKTEMLESYRFGEVLQHLDVDLKFWGRENANALATPNSVDPAPTTSDGGGALEKPDPTAGDHGPEIDGSALPDSNGDGELKKPNILEDAVHGLSK